MRIVGNHLTFVILLTMLACAPGGHVFALSLAWDATLKHYDAQRGETNVILVFNVTNISSAEVFIKAVRPSCGCTVAKIPTLPWRLGPNEHGQLKIDVDLRGRQGLLTKTIDVDTSAGTNVITVDVKLPELDPREKNRLVAFTDRQAVFKGDCARCHLAPATGKTGKELYKAICAICHEGEHRAEMVPDLAALKRPADKAFWVQTLRIGKPGTFMPAFSKPFGGPLNDEEIASLVTYLMDRFRPASDIGNPFSSPAK